ncbi:hypothetical protein VCHA36O157_20270 [Vibrio chagasii]|nr:hypothetical protein VCHA36O157_20270 [Vibrio chagasii]
MLRLQPVGLSVLLSPFTGVLFVISFLLFVNDSDIMVEGLGIFGYIWGQSETNKNRNEQKKSEN